MEREILKIFFPSNDKYIIEYIRKFYLLRKRKKKKIKLNTGWVIKPWRLVKYDNKYYWESIYFSPSLCSSRFDKKRLFAKKISKKFNAPIKYVNGRRFSKHCIRKYGNILLPFREGDI